MKYKLIKEYPGSPKLGDIVIKEYGVYSRKDKPALNKNDVENNPEYWQEIKPLFYTEDFIDGTFPEQNCDSCNFESNTCGHSGECRTFNSNNQYDNWQGELKGEAIYEDDECWAVWQNPRSKIVNKSFSTWGLICFADVEKVKYFSNEKNAKTYSNKLKWQDKLKFKIGERVLPDDKEGFIFEIDFEHECYDVLLDGEKYADSYPFKYQHQWNTYLFPSQYEKKLNYLYNVNRVEVIDQKGRSYVNYNVSNVFMGLQDNESTLKLFINTKN